MELGALYSVLSGLPWPCFVVSLDQEVLYWDPRLQELLGYSPAAAVGRRCWELGLGLGGPGLTSDCREGCVIQRTARVGMVPASADLDMRASWGAWRRVSVVPVALGHLGWVDRLLVFVLVSVRERDGEEVADVAAQLWRAALPKDVSLTAREREVMVMVARGLRNAQVAEELGVSLNTVRSHVANVRGKLGVSSRMEAALVCLRLGLIELR